VALNLFWPVDLKKYPMDHFAMLIPHQQTVETSLCIGQWTRGMIDLSP